MGAVECVGDLPAEPEHLGGGQYPLRKPLGQRLAVHQLHHQVVGVALAPDIEQCADVRMVERRDRLCFPLEPRAYLGVGREVLRQHLDRDLAAKTRVPGAEHLAHAARAERGGDLVGAEAGSGGKWHRANLHDRRPACGNRSHGRRLVAG
jgi:hypothetical protein